MHSSSAQKIEVRRFAGWEEAAPYKNAWNAIVQAAAGGKAAVPSVFQTYEWNYAWWQSFGKSYELLLLGVFDGDALVGIAPLAVTRKSFPVAHKVLSFMGIDPSNFASDYCSFIFAPDRTEVLELCMRWLDANPEVWDALEFANLLEDSHEFQELKKRFVGYSQSYFISDAPTIFLGEPGTGARAREPQKPKATL